MNRTGTTVLLLALAAAPAGADSGDAALSANGRFLVFLSSAQNLVAGVADRNNATDVFLFDRATGETVLVSRSIGPEPATANRESQTPAISANGRFVAFTSSATDLVPGQVEGDRRRDVFLWDRVTGKTRLVSHAAGSQAQEGNGASIAPALNTNGRFVTFQSHATDLVDGIEDANTSFDIFLWDRRSGEIVLVSRSGASPGQTANRVSFAPTISADGRSVAFISRARDAAPGQNDTNRTGEDVFFWDRATGTTSLVSHAANSPLRTGNSWSNQGQISADGRWIVYHSDATDLAPGQGGPPFMVNVFLWNRETGKTTLVSHAASATWSGANGISLLGPFQSISADGSTVAFLSDARNLVRGQNDRAGNFDAFVWDRASGAAKLLSGVAGSTTVHGSGDANSISLSADGRIVAWITAVQGVVAGVSDTNGISDVFVRDRATGTTTLLSRATGSAEAVGGILRGVSADGRFIAFTSESVRLVPGQIDSPGTTDLFLHDRISGTTRLVSHVAGSPMEAAGIHLSPDLVSVASLSEGNP